MGPGLYIGYIRIWTRFTSVFLAYSWLAEIECLSYRPGYLIIEDWGDLADRNPVFDF
jgi:hypothetical protein